MSDTTTATAAPGPSRFVRLVWALAALGVVGLAADRLERALSETGSMWDWFLLAVLPFTFLWCVGNALGYWTKRKT